MDKELILFRCSCIRKGWLAMVTIEFKYIKIELIMRCMKV